MRRNHRAQATVEPSWWSNDGADVTPPDGHNDFDPRDPAPDSSSSEYDPVSEAEPPLLTHTAPLRLIDPAAPKVPDEPVLAPVQRPAPSAPVPSSVSATPGILDPTSVQLVTCYAIDYLSWDATNPDRRATALARYLPGHTLVHPRDSGWSGRGRQRATFAVTGATRRDDADHGVLWIDVRVLITCYQHDPALPPAVPAVDPGELASDVSSAPAPDASGWRALDSSWVHIEVPLVHDAAGRPHIRPDLQPTQHQDTDHQPTDRERHRLTAVPAASAEGE